MYNAVDRPFELVKANLVSPIDLCVYQITKYLNGPLLSQVDM